MIVRITEKGNITEIEVGDVFFLTVKLRKMTLINIVEREPSIEPETVVQQEIPLACGDVLKLKYSTSPMFYKVCEFFRSFNGMHFVDFENKEMRIEIIC